MKKYKVLIVLVTTVFTIKVNAQNELIPVWKDSVPGALRDENYTEKDVFKNNILQQASQVVTPTLTVYRPEGAAANGTAIIICPGGGYSHLAINKEGTQVAKWLNSLGITAFVLKYRLPDDRIMKDKNIGPLQDVQEAMRIVRRNAAKWKLDTHRIGIMGFSAGGHLAATLSTHYNETVYHTTDTISARPDFSLLLYPVISMKEGVTHKGSQTSLLGKEPSDELIRKFSDELCVNAETPPAFLALAADDTVVPPQNSIDYFSALKKNNVPAEIHIYEKGGHGFGLGKEDTSLYWTSDCSNWLKSHSYL